MIDLTGIIDLGTNTFKLLVVRRNDDGTPVFVHKRVLPVKLGKGGIGQNRISDEAFERGIDAFGKLNKTAENYECNSVIGIATSSVRSAENGEDFINVLKEKYNREIRVISGSKEAELIYHGVKNAVPYLAENYLIMDIGGGSTEFIIASGNQKIWSHSFDVGAARLTELFNVPDQLQDIDKENIRFYLEQNLHPLFEALSQFPCKTLVGCSGSFETFFSVIKAAETHNEDEVPGKKKPDYEFDDRLNELIIELISSNEGMRLKTPGLPEMRVDSIHCSAFLTSFILENLLPEKIFFSRYSMKEGIWFRLQEENNKN